MKLLIIGTGSMAEAHARNFIDIPGVSLVTIVETNPERLQVFGDKYGVANRFSDLDAAIAWGDFDAAANVTPDAVHHPTTMKLIAAGKHVFCEKPLATVYPLAMEMTEAAEARGLINMVNLTYRASPALHKARDLATSGALAGLVVPEVTVDDIGTTSKTLPEFPELWTQMLGRAPGATRWETLPL